jgi:hypothetical protein
MGEYSRLDPRLDVTPREGIRVAVGGLREVASDEVGPRKRLIEGEIIIANKSSTPFAYRPGDFRLAVDPWWFQIQGVTVSSHGVTGRLEQPAVRVPVPASRPPESNTVQGGPTPALAFRWQIGRNRGVEQVRKHKKTRIYRSFKVAGPGLEPGTPGFSGMTQPGQRGSGKVSQDQMTLHVGVVSGQRRSARCRAGQPRRWQRVGK